MKIVVMGVGAMGSVYAALLADAGHEVWAVDTWPDHVDAINARGLRLEGASGDRVVKSIRATSDVADVGPCDLCLIATKASGVGPAARAAARAAAAVAAAVATTPNASIPVQSRVSQRGADPGRFDLRHIGRSQRSLGRRMGLDRQQYASVGLELKYRSRS